MASNDPTRRSGAGFMSALTDRQSRCVRRSYLQSSTYGDSGDTWQLEYGRSAPICAWHEEGLFAYSMSDLELNDVDLRGLCGSKMP
jgi:hypothetical protein